MEDFEDFGKQTNIFLQRFFFTKKKNPRMKIKLFYGCFCSVRSRLEQLNFCWKKQQQLKKLNKWKKSFISFILVFVFVFFFNLFYNLVLKEEELWIGWKQFLPIEGWMDGWMDGCITWLAPFFFNCPHCSSNGSKCLGQFFFVLFLNFHWK